MRWLLIFLAILWAAPARAQADLSPEERRAAYCYGVAVEMDQRPTVERLLDFLEKERGLHMRGSPRSPLAIRLMNDIGAVGAQDAAVCKKSPGGTSCGEVAVCHQQAS
jgi:hypothetical protein